VPSADVATQEFARLIAFLNSEVGELQPFQAALRGAVGLNSGQGEPHAVWAALEPFAEKCSLKIEIRDSGPVLKPGDESGPCVVIAPMLAIVYEAIATGAWMRLKTCRNPQCRSAFYDRSKNASGAWCSMALCGNRMKARRRRKRAFAARLDSGS